MLQEHERTTYMQLGNMRMILEKWKMGIRREKHIFATLNRFKELPSDMLQARVSFLEVGDFLGVY